jgi:hypothetical protein
VDRRFQLHFSLARGRRHRRAALLRRVRRHQSLLLGFQCRVRVGGVVFGLLAQLFQGCQLLVGLALGLSLALAHGSVHRLLPRHFLPRGRRRAVGLGVLPGERQVVTAHVHQLAREVLGAGFCRSFGSGGASILTLQFSN